ncbi:MAG: 2-amino-4-hydroxy-6-hydroxymethyldihydropteridine diphosphokinase, partial [Xanthomonadaceae bacterium]|nr:2-amino-4-hydroxy-6-hydroxymethyldihydropteridine diphosphokinase [Xanthomonadaceae bacterium]
MIDMARCWLLQLGSNFPSDKIVRSALAILAGAGILTTLTKIKKFGSYDGKRRSYYNVLVSFVAVGERNEIVAMLKRIERELGRSGSPNDTVTIDLDILASLQNAEWIPDRYALQKREFERPPVVAMLRDARIRIKRNGLPRGSHMNGNTDRLTAYLPRWLRWALMFVLGSLVAGFSVAFFLGINQPGFKDWLPASVSVVQIALTALAYVLLLFFTESGQNPAALDRRTEQVLTSLLPKTLARITDVQGQQVLVTVGPRSGVVGRDYTLRSTNTEMRFWIGLNVHRVIVILYALRPENVSGKDFKEKLETSFSGTVTGARRVGYDEA